MVEVVSNNCWFTPTGIISIDLKVEFVAKEPETEIFVIEETGERENPLLLSVVVTFVISTDLAS
jgi:hypothetical protein